MTSRKPILGPCAWHGAEMATSSRWIRTLEAADIVEIDAALRRAQGEGVPWQETTAENFPLERYQPLELRQIWFGIGSHVGRPIYQNFRGELMREIKDEGAEVGERYGQLKRDQGSGGVFLSSYARTLSNGALRFHTDRCDVVGLLCVRQADTGGRSLLCSSVAVHNEMLRRRPDLLEALFENVYRSRLGEEKGGADMFYPLPIFGVRDGKFTSHYSLTYI